MACAFQLRVLLLACALLGAFVGRADAQLVLQSLNESFTHTTTDNPNWILNGPHNVNYTPNLTAISGGGQTPADANGTGWLRMTDNQSPPIGAGPATGEATSIFYNQAFNSKNTSIYASFDYAAWGGNGADGLTFFLFDASVVASGTNNFSPGAYGGSLGYAQKTVAGTGGVSGITNTPGLTGGYLGVGLDEFGNFSNGTEGRIGGMGFQSQAIAVRGQGSGYNGYDFVDGTGTLAGGLAFPSDTSRPVQTGSEYRKIAISITPTNQLTVYLQDGATGALLPVFNANLTSTRPDQLMLGFTAGNGGQNDYHEIRNFNFSTYSANLWKGVTSNWGDNANWNPTAPLAGADIIFDNSSAQNAQAIDLGGQSRVIRTLGIDAPFTYTINNGTLEFNIQGNNGSSGIFVSQQNGVPTSGSHTINANLLLDNTVSLSNNSTAGLLVNGYIDTNGQTLTADGTGNITLANTISGGGGVSMNGSGNLLLSVDNSYAGGTTLNSGTLTVHADHALGTGNITLNAGTLTSDNGNTISNNLALQGTAGLSSITTSGTLTQTGGNYTLDLNSAKLTGAAASGVAVNLSNNGTARTLTVQVDGSNTSTISGTINDGGSSTGGNLTKTGLGTLVLSGQNNYSGTTTINSGILQLGASDVLKNTSALNIAGGTFNLNGNSQKVGNLSFSNNGVLDFGLASGANTFVFGNIASQSGTLSVNNWEQGLDKFGTTTNGLDVTNIYISGIGPATLAPTTSPFGTYGSAYAITPTNLTWTRWTSTANTEWNRAANWAGGVVPNSNTALAAFGKAGTPGPGTVNADLNAGTAGNRTVNGLLFAGDSLTSYTINGTGRTLTMDSFAAGIDAFIQQQSSTDQTISVGTLRLYKTTVMDVSGTGDLIINSPITDPQNANNNNTYSDIIKNSAGSLILNGSNTGFYGNIWVNAGTLRIGNSNALGTGTGITTVASGATLEVIGGINDSTYSPGITIAGAGVGSGGAIRGISGNNTLNGAVTLSGDATIKADANTLTLTGGLTSANTVNGNLTFGGSGNINVNSAITTNAGGVTIASGGTVTYSGGTGTDNTYKGTTAVNSGTLMLGKTAGVVAVAGPLVIGDGSAPSATVQLSAANQTTSATNVTVNSDGIFNLANNSTTIGQLQATLASASVTLGTANLTVAGAGNYIFAGSLTGAGGSILTKSGSGQLALTKDNRGTFLGTTSINQGSLSVQSTGALGNGAVSVVSGGNLQLQSTIALSYANPTTLNGTGTPSNNGAMENVAGNNSVTGGITLGSAARINSDAGTLTISTANITGAGMGLTVGGVGNTTISSAITTGAAGTLTKDGAGTLAISGANTYQGATNVNNGTLQLGANNALTNYTDVKVASPAILDVNGKTVTIGSLGNSATNGGGTVNLNGGSLTSGSANNSNSTTFSGAITGSGTLTKAGTGTLTLSGNNSYTGNTNVSAGTLIAASSNALGGTASTSTVNATATLGLQGNITIPSGESITLNGAGVGNAGALLNVSGANTVAGTVSLATDSTIGASAGTLNLTGSVNQSGGTRNLTTAGAGNITLTAASNLAGTVTIGGSGTVTLANSGGTVLGSVSGITVNTGNILALGAGNQINNSANLTLAGGTFTTGGFSETIGRLTLNSNSTVDFGNGTASVLTFTNATRTAGTLTISSWDGIPGIGGGGSQLILSTLADYNAFGDVNFAFSTFSPGSIRLGTGEIVPIATGHTFTWGQTTGGTWSTNNNWNPTSGNPSVINDIAIFDNTSLVGTATVNRTAASQTGYLSFTGSGANQYAITGSNLDLSTGGGNAQINVANGAAPTITANIILRNGLNVSNNSSGTLTIGGTINSQSAATQPVSFSGTGTTVVNGIIGSAGNPISTLTKRESGTLLLNAANLYIGVTTIREGTIAVGNNTALGNAASNVELGDATTPGTGTIALLIGNAAGGITLSRALDINNYGAGTTLGGTNTSNTNIFSGTITLYKSVTLTAANGGTVNFSGQLANASGTNSITKIGGGTVVLSNASNNYTGDTNISGGTLQLGNATALPTTTDVNITSGTLDLKQYSATIGSLQGTGTVDLSAAAATNTLTTGDTTNTLFSGTITDSGAGSTLSLIKNGTGRMTLSGANTYAGTTAINVGTIALQNSGTLGTGATTVASGASLQVSNLAGSVASAIKLNGNGMGGAGAIESVAGSNTLAGALTVQSNSRLQSDSGTLTATNTVDLGSYLLDFTGAGNTAFSNVLSGTGGRLVMDGTGTLTLSGTTANTFSGGVTLNSGTVILNKTAGVSATGSGGVAIGDGAGGSNTAILQLAQANQIGSGAIAVTIWVDGKLDLNNNNQTVASISDGVGGGGSINLGNATLITGDTTNTTFSGSIGGTGSLTKQGTGRFTLSGTNNTYTGATTISGGTLQLGNTNALPSATAVNITSGTLDLNRYSVAIGSLQGGGTVDLSTAATTATLTTGNATNTTYSGNITDSGAGSTLNLVKSGTGTMTLSGANTYAGTTTVNTGTLSIGADTNLGSGTLNLSGGILQTTAGFTFSSSRGIALGAGGGTIDTTGTLAYGGTISGSGSLTKTNSGTLTLTGVNTYTGATTINAGTLTIGAGGALSTSSAITINNSGSSLNVVPNNTALGSLAFNGGSLTTAAGTTTSIGGTLTAQAGGGTLAIGSGGTLNLTGAMAGTGTLTINSGALTISDPVTFGGNIIVNSGATLNLASLASGSTFSGTITLNGGTLNLGTGTGSGTYNIAKLTVTGTSTIDFGSGAVTLNGGTFDNTGSTLLNVTNWVNAVDYFFAQNWTYGTTNATMNVRNTVPENLVSFALSSTNYAASNTAWLQYGANNMITPAPEPSTYGAIFMGLSLVGLGFRRWRASRKS